MVLRVRIPHLLPIMTKEELATIANHFVEQYGELAPVVGIAKDVLVVYVKTDKHKALLPLEFEGLPVKIDVVGEFIPAEGSSL